MPLKSQSEFDSNGGITPVKKEPKKDKEKDKE